MSKPVLLLMLCVGLIGSNSLLLSPIAGSVATAFAETNAADVMIASAAFGLGTAISALLIAPLADRFGADRLLSLMLSLLAVGLGLSAAAPALWLLVAGQSVAGLASGAALPAIYALSAVIAPRGRESETLGAVLLGWTLSMVLGVSGASFVADTLGWRILFASLCGLASVAAFAVWRTRSVSTDPGDTRASTPLSALAVPGAVPTLGAVAAFMLAFYGVYLYVGAHVHDALERSTSAAGVVTLAYGVGFGLAQPLDRVIDRIGAERVRVPVFLSLAGLYGLLALSVGAYAMLIVMSAAWGLVNHFALNLIVSHLNALTTRERGALLGLYSAVTYLAVAGASLLFKPVYVAGGLAACAGAAAVVLLPALGWAWRSRHVRAIEAD